MADENVTKDETFYDIDKETYEGSLKQEHEQFSKEINDEIDVIGSPPSQQTTTIIFNTRKEN